MYSVFSHRTCAINDGVLLDSLLFLFGNFRPTVMQQWPHQLLSTYFYLGPFNPVRLLLLCHDFCHVDVFQAADATKENVPCYPIAAGWAVEGGGDVAQPGALAEPWGRRFV